jgi:hypothetical protein
VTTREALVDSPLNHGRYLHGAGEGYVTVGQKIPDWDQHSYQTQKLYDVLPAYGGVEDAYISLNRFWGSRAVFRLVHLCALYTDIDYYKVPGLVGAHPLGVMELAFEELESAKIPHPSLAVATGRGLALIWRLAPVPRAALSRWTLCQDQIFKALKDLGADPSARDAARVFRLVGTRNSKSGTIVEAIWEDQGDDVWIFDDLANEILPFTREELAELRAQRGQQKKAAIGARRAPKGPKGTKKRFTVATLAEGRLSDLQYLLKLRGLEKLPPGQRDHWMFVAGTSLACLVEPQFLERKLIALGRDYAGWGEAETKSRMHSVISRAHAAKAGETLEWNGQQRDLRYRLTNHKIIEKLGITPSEEKEMKVLISKDTKRQRAAERKRQQRRAQGAKSRDEISAAARERESLAKELHRQGLSYREIGEKLCISRQHAGRLVKKKKRVG